MSNILSLTKDSSSNQIETYFNQIFRLNQSGEKFPVNLDVVWPLVFTRKEESVRELKRTKNKDGYTFYNLGVDYQVIRKNAENPKGGRPTNVYHLSVPCLEFFIAKKVRRVFEVYRQVFHKVMEQSIQLPNFNDPPEAARAWADQFEKRELVEKEVLVLKPKAEYCDMVLKAENTFPITIIAKELGMTAKVLNEKLYIKGIQYKIGEQWFLRSKYDGNGFTKTKTIVYRDSKGISKTSHLTLWTEKGRLFIINLVTDLFTTTPKQSYTKQI